MDNIDKLNTIFKSGDIALGVQLVKSLDLELYDVLLELYNRYKYFHNESDTMTVTWWVLNQQDFSGVEAVCIKDTLRGFLLWTGQLDIKRISSLNYNNLEDCMTELARILKETYG